MIVEEFHLPASKRKIQHLDQFSTPVYVHQNIMFRLAWKSDNLMFDKCLNHEFTANDIMANALFLLNRNETSFKFRVPLFAL